jgi:PTH1 family peptidyl-tRNA hydrolase
VPSSWDPADFVLSRFTKEEREVIEPALTQAAEAVEDWLDCGIQECMNKYN